MPVDEMRILNFSVNKANGMVVVKRELETLSAAELSDNVGIRMGIRKPGWNLVVVKMSAICAEFLNSKYPSASCHASEYLKLKNLHCKEGC